MMLPKQNRRIRDLKIFCNLILLLIFLSSCASSKKLQFQQTGDYKVTVVADGEEITDFNTALVHRIAIDPSQLVQLEKGIAGSDKLNLAVDKTLAGDIAGVSVIASDLALLELLGLQQGDLIMAINTTRVDSKSKVEQLLPSLQNDSKASITLQRQGSPHKILYFLQGK